MIIAGLRGVTLLARLLPWKPARAIGGGLGGAAYSLLTREREKARKHFALAFGDGPGQEAPDAIIRRSFENLGKSLVEVLKLPQINSGNIDRFVRFEGEDNLKAAFEEKKGVVFVTAHFGNWEIMGAALSIKGYPVNVVAAPLYDPRLDEIMKEIRAKQGIQTITRGEDRGGRKILAALKNNQILGLLIDQDIDADGVFVDFFNRPAYTPSGAASLALKSGAAVVFGFVERDEKDFHTVRFEGPVPLTRTGDFKKDVYDNTAWFTKVIEKNVRRRPDQWVWMHNRWKTVPGADHEHS